MSYYFGDKRGWIRIFNRTGVCWKHEIYGLTFSERHGLYKYFKIWNYYFRFLKNKLEL